MKGTDDEHIRDDSKALPELVEENSINPTL
jgi:hypothetical protein